MQNQRGFHRLAFLAFAAGAGFLALLVQVVVTRELLASFFGDELIIGLVLAAWLLLVALGAWLAAGLRLGAASWHLAAAFVLLAPAVPWAVYVARAARSMGDWPGEVVGPGSAILWSGAALLAPCVLLGAAFAMAVRYAEGALAWGPRAPARVYMTESLGALLGGLLFHFYLADHLVAMTLAVALAAVASAAAFAFAVTDLRLDSRARALFAMPLILLLIFAPHSRRLERLSLRERWRGFDLVTSRNTRYGNLAVCRAGGQFSFFYDGLLASTTEDTLANEELAHLALLSANLERIHRRGEQVRVLVIGGGFGGLLREIARHPVDSVDYVELDAQALQVMRRYAGGDEARLLGRRLRIINADLRALDLAHRDPEGRPGPPQYAAIIYNLPPPSNALLARLYSQEFLSRQLRPALDPDGTLILRLPGPQTTLGHERAMLHASVYRALEGAGFMPAVAVGDGGVYLVVRLWKGPYLSASLMADRRRRRHITTSLLTPDHLSYMLLPFRQEMYLRSIRQADSPATTDQRPACYRYYLALSARQFSDRLADALDAAPRFLIVCGAAVLLLIFIVLGFRRRIGAPVAAAIAMAACGFAAMALTFTVMLEFQIRAGYLFHQLGLLTALFMGGLAAGSFVAGRRADRFTAPLVLGFLALAFAAAVPWFMASKPDLFALRGASIACGLAAFLGGFGGGIVYALSVALAGGEASPAAARLYAVDLAASAAGALIVAVVVVPVAGIPWACATVLLACGLGAAAASAGRR
jgi:spermidine synthase